MRHFTPASKTFHRNGDEEVNYREEPPIPSSKPQILKASKPQIQKSNTWPSRILCMVRHLSCFPLGTRPARNAVSVRNCTTITVAFAYVSSWVLMVFLLQLLSLSLDPSFPNQALRRELCIVSCQVLNLPPRPSVRPSPMKMGAFQPSFSCRLDPSFLPSLLSSFFLLRRPPTFAMEIYLWTRKRLPRPNPWILSETQV